MLMTIPGWLPPIVRVDGRWEDVLRMLYGIFTEDFIESGPTFKGLKIQWDKRIVEGNYEEGFWHLITKTDSLSGERLLDSRRAERLPWCAPTISNAENPAVRVWDYLEGNGRIRTYLWLNLWDYVVILEKRPGRSGEIAFLITAYYIEGASTRRNLQRKYEHREN